MNDRKAILAAELADFEEDYVSEEYPYVVAAARKQLALMPEKCEHGKVEPHWFGFDVTTKETCSGKVYPQETVEKIKAVLKHWDAVIEVGAIVAVLDALNDQLTDVTI